MGNNKNKTYLFMKGGNKKLEKVVLTRGCSIKYRCRQDNILTKNYLWFLKVKYS